MTDRRRVVFTGASGRIGRAAVQRLGDEWDVVATDLRGEHVTPLDVTDLEACAAAFAGADAVVHLAANPSPEATWEELLPVNVIGTHQVAAAAMQAGVRRLVLASSLQAVSAYPADLQVRGADAPRPANLYGATKAWAEALGAWVAATSPVEVVALRIGYYLDEPPAGPGITPRDVAGWLSLGDAARLLRASVEGPVDRLTVLNGVSANRYRKAEHGEAERRIGYEPVDDAFAEPRPAPSQA